MKLHKTRWIAHASMIAAIYIIVTWLFAPFGFGEIQVRISEALTILPAFTPAAVPGLFVGCLIGNILGGAILPDIIFGSLATLIGAVLVYRMRDKHSFLLPLPPILSNTLIVPFVLRYGYGIALPFPLLMFSIGIGELISCGVLRTFPISEYTVSLWPKSIGSVAVCGFPAPQTSENMENTPSGHCAKHIVKNIVEFKQTKLEYKLTELNTPADRT